MQSKKSRRNSYHKIHWYELKKVTHIVVDSRTFHNQLMTKLPLFSKHSWRHNSQIRNPHQKNQDKRH